MAVIFAILLFSLLIFVHELGHFVTAKLSGVKVNEFAMFMGPALLKWERGGTKYSIRCIPIGGYCAMEGENEDTEDPHSFQKAAWWKRLIILVAGAAMNLIAGLLLLAIFYAPKEELGVPVISYAEEGCTVVSENGLHIGDKILEVDGETIYIDSDFNIITSLKPSQTRDLVVLRNGEKVVLNDFLMETHQFPGETGERYGFSFSTVPGDFGNTAKYVAGSSASIVRSVRLSLTMLLTGQAGLKDVSGPVGIVQIMSDTAEASGSTGRAIMNMLYLGGFLAINLAVMNLLPIPALDGGRVVGLLLTTVIEKITRKKLDPKYEGYIHGVGMVLLLALMAVILFKDVFTIFKG